MKKLVLIVGFIALTVFTFAQNNYPVVGVSDVRTEIYGLKNATVVIDYSSQI